MDNKTFRNLKVFLFEVLITTHNKRFYKGFYWPNKFNQFQSELKVFKDKTKKAGFFQFIRTKNDSMKKYDLIVVVFVLICTNVKMLAHLKVWHCFCVTSLMKAPLFAKWLEAVLPKDSSINDVMVLGGEGPRGSMI